MSTNVDKEIEAIGTLLKALEPLDPKARQSVLNYVMRRLDILLPTTQGGALPPDSSLLPPGEPPVITQEPTGQVHIKDLVRDKKPKSAIEMATLVAYYLSHNAPQNERKQTINNKDIETYFKIGEFRLPSKPKFTLVNTKGAGYLDAVGDGEYKLNPVGYNLVVHSMPKTSERGASRSQRNKPSRKKIAPRK
jgi:hypothetical protein